MSPGDTFAEELLFSAAAIGNAERVQMALEHLEWDFDKGRFDKSSGLAISVV